MIDNNILNSLESKNNGINLIVEGEINNPFTVEIKKFTQSESCDSDELEIKIKEKTLSGEYYKKLIIKSVIHYNAWDDTYEARLIGRIVDE